MEMRLDEDELIRRLRRDFSKLNPDIDPETIDFRSNIDPYLTLGENVELMQKAFPTYRWE